MQSNLDKERERYQKLTKEVELLMKSVNDTLSAAKNSKVFLSFIFYILLINLQVQTQIAGIKKDVEACTSKYKFYVEEYRTLHNQYYVKQQPHLMRVCI